MKSNIISYSRPRWVRRLLVLTVFLLLVAVAPAQNSRAQSRHCRARLRPIGPLRTFPANCWSSSATALAVSATAATLAAQTGLAVQDTIPQLGIAVVEATETATSAELAAAAAALEASPAVEWAEPNYTFTLDATPDDPYYATQAPYLNRLEMPAAWDYTTDSPMSSSPCSTPAST